MNQLSAYNSNKISIFHGIGIVFVMLNHIGYQEMQYSTMIVINSLATCGQWAVCMYIVLAGYLLYYGIDHEDITTSFDQKYRRRLKTLFIPFVLWSVFGTILYTFLYKLGLRDEWTVMAHNISGGSYLRLFCNPGMLQMWFVRDLIWCVIFSIPFYFLIRKLGIIVPIALYVYSWYRVDVPIWLFCIPVKSFLFFTIGACFSIHKWSIDSRCVSKASAICLLLFSFGIFLLQLFIEGLNIPHFQLLMLFLCFVSVWVFYDHFPDFFDWLSSYFSLPQRGFFMFATFEPFYYLSKHLVVILLGDVYLSSTYIQIVILIMMYVIIFYTINRIAATVYWLCPTIYRVLTGGR